MFTEKEYSMTESGSKAETECRQALAQSGYAFGVTPASFHWSQLINPLGDKALALLAYETLIEQEPDNKAALEGIAYLYQIQGQADMASQYRQKLREVEARDSGIDEDSIEEVVSYLMARTGEAEQPDIAPLAYTKSHFDRYADSFDDHLVGKLEYCGPKLIKEKLDDIDPIFHFKSVLDLGCGTGLLGKELSEKHKNITGVDISGKMLSKAKSLGVYQSLSENDINTFLEESTEQYSVIVAADVLIYLGDLEPTFKLAFKNLKENGVLVFTTENSETVDVVLRNTGRYQHSSNYINKLATDFGFSKLSEESVQLRKEDGQYVDSTLYVLCKTSETTE